MQRLISSRFSSASSIFPLHIHHSSQLPFIEEVKLRLQNGQYKFESSDCPCRGRKEDVIISEIDRYGLSFNFVVCMRCGTVRIDPYLDAASLEDFYTRFYQQMYGRSTDLNNYFLGQKSYGEKVLSVSQSFLKPESWVIEIGCGAGGALQVFQKQGYRVAGCDYSNELIEAGRQKGVENIYFGSLDEVGNGLKGIKFDLIYIHHVFEHLNDPFSFLKGCREYLAPGGKIVVVIPALDNMDACRVPAGNLLLYLHISHKYNFSFTGIQRLCHKAGYSVVKLNPDPKMKTPCSSVSELWVQMMIEIPSVENSEQIFKDMGVEMLRYLERTEKFYSLGLCKGQLLKRIDPINVLLKRVQHKIKNLSLQP